MSAWRQLRRGLRALINRRAHDADLRAEVEDYIERATASGIARGLSPSDARRVASIELGNATVAVEAIRSYGWENAVDAMVGDLRYALRRLRGSPGFTVVSVLTLSLGIGASAAIFSAVNPILFASLPYPEADRLVAITDVADDGGPQPATFGTFAELRARGRSFTSLAVSDRWEPSLTGTDQPERLHGQRVTAGYFATLRVQPAVGRSFADGEDLPGGPSVAVLSDRVVRRRFGGDRSIVGRKVMVDDHEYIIIGVMGPDFENVAAPSVDIWAPLQDRARAPFNSREWGHHYQIVGRLAAGATPDAAAGETRSIGRTPGPEFPRPRWADMRNGLRVRSLQDDIARDARPTLLAIAGAALLLLSIACVNVTNLLMARGAQRRGEFAMRVALGAGRGRLLRQLLTESLVLAGAGGLLGLGVAQAGVRSLVALSPPGLPRAEAIRLDGAVFAFALLVTTVVGLVVGFVPALGATRAELRDDLHRGSRRAAGGTGIARGSLVVAEVALALMLLTGAGLLLHSLERLFAVAPGFDPAGVVTMQVAETGRSSQSDSARARFYEDALDAVRHLPGVTAAAFTSQLPLSGDLDGYGYELQAKTERNPGQGGSLLRYSVSPDYFAVMRIPLIRGRLFDASDRAGATESIVVSESFAKREFGNVDPIGQRVRFGPETGSSRPWDIIVGVVGDVKQESLAASQTDAFYVPVTQWSWVDNVQSLTVRTSGNAAALAPSLERAIWAVDANQPIQRITTMDGLIAASASQRQFALIVIESFAIAALLLAAIGLYGVIAGVVAERTREIGIRTALGATPRNIMGSVLGRGVALTAIGVVLGIAGAAASSALLESLLFGTSRLDPATYGAVVALLVVVAILACWIPASRASTVDPAITLRAD